MPLVEQLTKSWDDLSDSDIGQSVATACRAMWDQDSARRARMLSNVRRYEGIPIQSLDPVAYTGSASLVRQIVDENHVNLVGALVDTIVAKIAGTQQPKVQFVASSADWKTRRKGPKLQQFVEGLNSTRQEPYADVWELFAEIFRDSAVCGVGYLKTWADVDAGRVVKERALPWEILVDPIDAAYGCPGKMAHVYAMPKDALKALMPEHSDRIDSAPVYTGIDGTYEQVQAYGSSSFAGPSVRCYELWCLQLSTSDHGLHVLALEGGATLILDRKWDRQSFPIKPIWWQRSIQGWGGKSLVDIIAPIDDARSDLLQRILECVRRTSIATLWVPEASQVRGDLVDNRDAAVNYYSGGIPPTVQNPAPFGPEHASLLELLKALEYEVSGINQMTATAQRPAGVDAAVAIRTLADLQSERFSTQWRSYQLLAVDSARDDIECVRELASESKDFSVRWPGSGFLKSIKWASVDIPDDMFVLRIDPAPSIKGTPADRLQTAQEMVGSGMLSQDAYAAVARYLDLPGELDRRARQEQIVNQYIENWLDADPDVLAGTDDLQSLVTEDGQPLYYPPDRWMRLEDALLQVHDAYLDARLNGVPDIIADLFLRWISAANSEIEKREERKAKLNQTNIVYSRAGEAQPQPPQPEGPPIV